VVFIALIRVHQVTQTASRLSTKETHCTSFDELISDYSLRFQLSVAENEFHEPGLSLSIKHLITSFICDNRELRRLFGPNRDAVRREWRRIHNEELYALYSSPNIIRVTKSRRLRWAGHVARMGERRSVYRDLVGKPERRRQHVRPRRRWEDNIKVGLR
jgi:hypothetical protein